MSDNGGGGVDQEPMAKRRRTLTEAELGGPIENEETAREKLEKARFDPDNIHETKLVRCVDGEYSVWIVNPICHFAGRGDLKMCRYLVAKGASTTDGVGFNESVIASVEWFPMAAAASNCMKDVCRWLYNHGAHNDTSREGRGDYCWRKCNPLWCALNPNVTPNAPNQDFETAQWLVLHGAIPSDIHGNPNEEFMAKTFAHATIVFRPGRAKVERERLLKWAANICYGHDAFFAFLCGTVHLRHDLDERRPHELDERRPINYLSGHQGIRKKIAEYAGVMTGRNLRTVRGIVGPLKKALADSQK